MRPQDGGGLPDPPEAEKNDWPPEPESERRYRSFIEMLPQIVYETDTQGRLVSVNRSAMTVTGYSEEDLRNGLTALDFVPPEDRPRAMANFMRVMQGETLTGNEYAILRKDGSIFPVMAYSSPREQDGRVVGMMGMMVDISERKRLEEERQRAQKMESVGLLAGGIAHDFNNLLMAIWGCISLAGLRKSDPEQLDAILGEAGNACRRARELTHQLLTFARGGKPVKKMILLEEVLRQTVSLALRGSRVVARFAIEPGLPSLAADEGQLGQVFHNLVINAVQAMPDGGVITILGKSLELAEGNVQGLDPGRYAEIEVADQGHGVPAESRARIFEPYYTTKETGSGLGLAVVYSIVRNHGGHVSLDTSRDRGAAFRVLLPVTEIEGQAVPATPPAEVIMGKGRILVMDDEEMVRTVTGAMLGSLGYETALVEEGGQAIAKYEAAMRDGTRFDAVILDLTVPGGMGGREAVQRILALDPHARVIVASGYAQDAVMADYRRHGFVAVAPKPFTVADLAAVLAAALAENNQG